MEDGALEVVRKGIALVGAPKAAGRVREAESGVSAPSVAPSFDEFESSAVGEVGDNFGEQSIMYAAGASFRKLWNPWLDSHCKGAVAEDGLSASWARWWLRADVVLVSVVDASLEVVNEAGREPPGVVPSGRRGDWGEAMKLDHVPSLGSCMSCMICSEPSPSFQRLQVLVADRMREA